MVKKESNLFAPMDDADLFRDFKIILAIQDKTVKEVSNEFVQGYVKKYSKLLPETK